MKKMQCEVCGSIEIKKVSEDIFECQSCGIQYSKNEVQKLLVEISGEVKIDHSQEIENALVRAEQFKDQGLALKALEYFNKVLDLAPNHEKALQGIAALKEKQLEQKCQVQAQAARDASAIKLVKHTVTPAEGLDYFLKSLKKDESIAPDIYKEIEIMSVQHGYFPFQITEKSYSGSYDAVACYRKQIPYTDYETKTDYNNKNQDGSYRKVQVAVTKYREEIERQKVDGSFSLNYLGAYSIGGNLNRMFTTVSPEKYDDTLAKDMTFDSTLNMDLWPNYANDSVLLQLEELISNQHHTLINQAENIFLSEQNSIDDLEIFGNHADPHWVRRIETALDSTIREKARDKVHGIVPGDFSEKVVYRWKETSSREQCIYLPIQVVEYAYRGKFYISAILLTEPGISVHTFPCYTALKVKKLSAQNDYSEISKIPVPSLAYIMGSFTLACIICGIRFGIESPDAFFVLTGIGCVFLIPAIISLLFWKRKKDRYKAEVNQNASALNREQSNYEHVLNNGYDTFFQAYRGYDSLEAVMKAVQKVSAYDADIQAIKACITSRVFSRKGGAKNQPTIVKNIWKDTENQELIEGCMYRVLLVTPGNQPSEVYRILREVRNIGIATAKEIAETPNTIAAQQLSPAEAMTLTDNLTNVGATARIEKESR